MHITVAITGASGAIYPYRFLNHLAAEPEISKVYLVASAAGLRVLHEELDLGNLTSHNLVEKLVADSREKVELLNNNDIGACIASGSFPVDAMAIIPCSMGTLGSIAHGVSRDLVQRAADVMLKERRKLLLVIRSFYHRPASINDAIDQFLFRVMIQLGLKPAKAYQWKGTGKG
jgi:flavin prenyltransferase